MEQYLPRDKQGQSACRIYNADARLQEQVKTRVATRRISGEFMRRCGQMLIILAIGVFAAGCPKGNQDYSSAKKSLDSQDYDAAVDYYLKAAKADPHNANYKIGLNQARFQAAQVHLHKGLKLRDKGELQAAISEFQRATVLDPSSIIADQELKRTIDLLTEKSRADNSAAEVITESATSGQPAMASLPPELKPLSRAPINLKMSNDAKVIYETIGKLAGLTVIYDPDLQAKRISTELNNVTLEQALDIVSLESKSFWKPVTENIIMIVPDTAQKRRDYEEQVVRTFYLNNVAIAQDLTEITTGLRQLLDLKRIQQVNAQNAIIIRDTPDKIALAEKIIRDIDKAKPEVIIQVQVLEARIDNLRNLGILPGQSMSVQINPNNSTSTSVTNGTQTATASTSTGTTLQQLTHLNQNDVVFTLPGATANFLLTDSGTRIIQDPELRAIDGQSAKLKIGDRVPVATGSFQAGVGVGSTGGAGFVNPLVNTQFQYIDVGVNIDVTPHVHANRDVSMKISVEVSAVTGNASIGGITQPIISQRKVEHEIRLKEGEVSILAGLISRVDQKTLNGWPGLAKIPGLRYLFSSDQTQRQEDEVLIVLTPRVVRLPDWTRANLRPIYSGTETFPGAKREIEVKAPSANPNPQPVPVAPAAPPAAVTPVPMNPVAPGPGSSSTATPGAVSPTQVAGPRIRFDPATLNLAPGQTATIGVLVDNVTDLYSVPMLLQYNPAIISVEEVRHGGFLSGGTQEIAIVQRVDKEHGQAIISATRQPNTPGVNGSGTLLGVVVKALAPGVTNLSIVQVNAKDSQQKAIPLVTSEATLRVQ
jgi:general secretion pathway protein D